MVVEVKNLTKRFADFTAVDNISFSMGKGEIVGFLGPNGAGKTTTIHMLLDLITPSGGEISIFGKDFRKHREEILQQMNFASPYVSLPYRLTVFENLMVFACIYNIEHPKKRIEELLEMFEIADLQDEPAGTLSSGQNTRVGLCKSLLNKPKLLLLDEPTASLDPEISHHVREILLRIREQENTSILYTSHNMAETENICDRIVFLNHGKIIADGTPIEITKAILNEERNEPALEEVFFRVIKDTKTI
ncbi:MAG: ABC transporter ATP-binding protein [Candidatus Abawacabacteria bacterium RBG_16_42_10]|uniref:ABC transporter ATP-binding protein n=1 Tax=Candidatus Abawacabacteria bacterium RBG_16_42_10 TaxID=1817814 RepID=A0A1F4XIR4_9BACT|nr:MAG: ABC transporter ATP-binding protein [Candidatus Abawacabacteria bacterium RBG_16_42_10]